MRRENETQTIFFQVSLYPLLNGCPLDASYSSRWQVFGHIIHMSAYIACQSIL
jgi:hypothetical protein